MTGALLLTLAFALPVPATAADPADDPGAACEQAGAMAERAAGLPNGVLRAIGIVESGRPDARLGRVAPWPWTIDLAGRPFFFETAAQAVAAADASRTDGALTADVGCFQISMLYHPSVFPDIQAAFDPAANARVAAGLLAGLRDRTGTCAASHCRIPLG